MSLQGSVRRIGTLSRCIDAKKMAIFRPSTTFWIFGKPRVLLGAPLELPDILPGFNICPLQANIFISCFNIIQNHGKKPVTILIIVEEYFVETYQQLHVTSLSV